MDDQLITLIGNLVLALEASNDCLEENQKKIGVNLTDAQVEVAIRKMKWRAMLNITAINAVSDYFARVQKRAIGKLHE